MPDTTFRAKANGSPCHRDCPERTSTCRPGCERFQIYEEERLRRGAKRDLYPKGSTTTAGQRKRHIHNLQYQKMHTQGKI